MSFQFWLKISIAIASIFACLSQTASGQISRYDKVREWSDASGKFKIQAKVVSANSDTVVLETAPDKKNLTMPIKKLSAADREFAKDFQDKTFENVEDNVDECLYAADAAKLYEEFQKRGFVDSGNQLLIETKIKELKKLAVVDAIIIPGGYLPKSELDAKKKESQKMVSDWIQQVVSPSSKFDDKELRAAMKADPTSLEAVILLALYYEVHEGDSDTAQRRLDKGIKRAEKYLALGYESDKTNLIAAINNLAVAFAKDQQVDKAQRFWARLEQLTNSKIPAPVKHNIAKALRLMKSRTAGLPTDSSLLKSFGKFAAKMQATGGSGGWQLMCPVDVDGKVRNNLLFVLADPKVQKIVGDLVHDPRCVKCDGTAVLRCPNKQCHDGGVKVPVMGRKSNLDGLDLGWGKIGEKIVKCTVCRGKSKVTCPCCSGGVQN